MKSKKMMLPDALIGFVSFLLLWECFHLLLNTHTVPAPAETLVVTFRHINILTKHALASIVRVVIAIGISLVIGCPIGIMMGMNKTLHQLFSPLLYFIYPIPKVAFLPVFMLMFGLGNTSKVMLMIWIIIFQIILSIRDGVIQIDPNYFKVMDSYNATWLHKYKYLIIPGILPNLFTGLRISIGIALATLFFAENYATTYGIGYYVLSAWTKMNYVEMFSGILVLGFVGIVLFKVLDTIEIKTTPWIK